MSTLKMTAMCLLIGFFVGMGISCQDTKEPSSLEPVKNTTELSLDKDRKLDSLSFKDTTPLRGNSNEFKIKTNPFPEPIIVVEPVVVEEPKKEEVSTPQQEIQILTFEEELFRRYGLKKQLTTSYLKEKGSKQALILALEMRQSSMGKKLLTLNSLGNRKIVTMNKGGMIVNDYSKNSKEIRSYFFNFDTNELKVVSLGAGGGRSSSVQNPSIGKTVLGDKNGSYLTPPGFFLVDLTNERYSSNLKRYVIPVYGLTVGSFITQQGYIIDNKNKNSSHLKAINLDVDNLNSANRAILIHSSGAQTIMNQHGVPGNTSQGCFTFIPSDYEFLKDFYPNKGLLFVFNYGDRIFKENKDSSGGTLLDIKNGLKEGYLTDAYVHVNNSGKLDTIFVRTPENIIGYK